MLCSRCSRGFVLILGLVLMLAGCGGPEQQIPGTLATPGAQPDLDGSEWIVVKLRGAGLVPGSNITLSFEGENAGGFAGCNAYGATYDSAGAGALSIGLMQRTLQACLEPAGIMEQEDAYLAALQATAAYRVTGDRLEIVDGTGASLLVLSRKERVVMDPADLAQTAWQMVSLNGARPVEGSSITIAFAGDGSASGVVGCREYTATYEANSDEIHFPYLSMSGDDACLADEALYRQEGQFTDALTWATNYRLGEEQLEIHTARGEVLIFEPLP